MRQYSLGETPEPLLRITLEYRDTRHCKCWVDIIPGEPVTIRYESGSIFRYDAGSLDYEALDQAARSLAGVPQRGTIGPIEERGREALGAGSGSSGRHDSKI